MSRVNDALKTLRPFTVILLAVIGFVAIAVWAVAGKVYALERRQAVMEATHELMAKQIDWLTDTVWKGRPTSPPPSRNDLDLGQ